MNNKFKQLMVRYALKDIDGELVLWDKVRGNIANDTGLIKILHQLGLSITKEQLIEELKNNPGIAKKRKIPGSEKINSIYESIKSKLPIKVYNKNAEGVHYLIDDRNQYSRVKHFTYQCALEAASQISDKVYNVMTNGFSEALNDELISFNTEFEQFLKKINSRILYDRELHLDREPALISWDPSKPAFLQLDSNLIKEGPTPNWDSFLSRMSHPEHYKAFIWSIFEPESNGRQVLWLQGAGKDGKSSAAYAICQFLGQKFSLSIGSGDYDDNFFWHRVYGKRLMVYGDCSNISFLRKEKIKQLTGSDSVFINPKGEHGFTANVYSKIIVNSNKYPHINTMNDSERSRLILINIAKRDGADSEMGDNNYKERLLEEMPAFLHKCRAVYGNHFTTHTDMKIPSDMSKRIETSCRSSDSYILESFIRNKLVFDSNVYVNRLDLQNALNSYLADNWQSKFKDYAYDDLGYFLSKENVYPTDIELPNGAILPNCFKGVRLKKENE